MEGSCVDPALHVLEQLYGDKTAHYEDDELEDSIRTTYWDLRFFKMFFWGLAYQEQSLEDDCHLRYVWTNMMAKFTKIAEGLRRQYECAADAELCLSWEVIIYGLRMKIEQYKPIVKEICILVLDDAFINSCQFEELFLEYGANTSSLIDLLLENIGLLIANFNLIAPAKQQFAFVEEKLKVFGKFANHISCLVCLHWIEGTGEGFTLNMECMLSDLVQKYTPYSPRVIPLYLDVFRATGYDEFQSGAIRRLTVSYANFVLEHLVIHSKRDIEALHHGLIFLLSFVMNPPKEDTCEKMLLLEEIYAIIGDVPSFFYLPGTKLSSFLHRIDRVKVQVAEVYVPTPLSLHFNYPKTNASGCLDSLLSCLTKMLKGGVDFTSVVKHQLELVEEQLELIRPYLQNNFELLNELQNFKHLWTHIVGVVYHAAYVTSLCPMTSGWVWYGILCLPNLIEEIKFVNSEVMQNISNDVYIHKSLMVEMDESINTVLQAQATSSRNEGTFIGFAQDVEDILNHLIGGRENLAIVSVSGMPGQGKTTLVKRIYNDPSIHLLFHKKAWCYVSKESNPKALLANISHGVGYNFNSNLDIQDSIEGLWRSLKGSRYLIVLDDVWDVDVWRQVGGSFPNDKNGSRILITSRIHDMSMPAEVNSIFHALRPFSDQESWELMKTMLSNCDGFPPEVLEIGKRIAVYCKGLPLAVALITSYLKRIEVVVDLWEQVAINLKSHLASEGCMHVIELSYKYLPDHLKSCFLYLGAFPRGGDIRAQRLKLLWIAEGFVKENRMQLAEEYLGNLVSQHLIVATERNSTGGIKRCRVYHDLLYDLCIEKGVQDNFLHLADRSITSSNQKYDINYRLCISDEDGPFTLPKSTSARRVLPTSQIHTLLWSCFLSKEPEFGFVRSFELLTVLDLDLGLSMFPGVVLHNIHLRYLAFGGCIKEIPASIVDLWNLETLVVRSRTVVQIPDSLWEMESLKYLHIEVFSLNLKVPWSISMAATDNVETLKGITLKYDLKTQEFLKRFVKLRNFKCYCGENKIIHPMWFSLFVSLQNLESLHLYSPSRWNDSPVYQPLPTLNFPNNLKNLTLVGFGLPWSVMSTVGKLANLEVLQLRFGACMGTTWHLEDGKFSKLRYLKLKYVDVERIDDSCCDHPFPRLQKLFLMECQRLKGIPSSFGDICTLDTIDVSGSYQVPADLLWKIVEHQRDMGNDSLRVLGLSMPIKILMEEDDEDDDRDSLMSRTALATG